MQLNKVYVHEKSTKNMKQLGFRDRFPRSFSNSLQTFRTLLSLYEDGYRISM